MPAVAFLARSCSPAHDRPSRRRVCRARPARGRAGSPAARRGRRQGERVPLPGQRCASRPALRAARRDRLLAGCGRAAHRAHRVFRRRSSGRAGRPGAEAAPDETVDFAVLSYAVTSMETETYRPARLILLGEDASPEQRRSTSLDALVTPQSPPVLRLAYRRGPLRPTRAHLPLRPCARGQPGTPRRARVHLRTAQPWAG
jgi:hypothetical protein